MCKAMEDMRREAMEKGMEKGTENERIRNIRNLMESFNMTAEQVMNGMKIPQSEQGKYLALLSLRV